MRRIGHSRDLRTCTFFMCEFVVTTVIIDIWSLGLHAENPTSIPNCPGWRAFRVMIVGEVRLHNWRQRIRMIHCRSVTEDADQGWSVAKVILRRVEIFGKGWLCMAESIGTIRAEVSSGWGAVSKMAPEWQRILVTWRRVRILRGSDIDHYTR